MNSASKVVALAIVLAGATPRAARAQTIVAGAAIQHETQRFAEEAVPNRLDGASGGWMVMFAARPLNHLLVHVDWSNAGTIADTLVTTLAIDGRMLTISSTFSHRTQALSALAGYTHGVGRRVWLAYVAGVSFTDVRRRFETNAPGLVLIGRSDPSASTTSELRDRFAAPAAGAAAFVSIARHVQILAGARLQRLTLDPDSSGWSVRAFAGGGVAF